MVDPISPKAAREAPPESTRVARMVTLVLILFSLGIAAVGFVRHSLVIWQVGFSSAGAQAAVLLQLRLLRRYGPQPGRLARFVAFAESLIIALPIAIGLGIAVQALLPNWFPSSCPLPPRH